MKAAKLVSIMAVLVWLVFLSSNTCWAGHTRLRAGVGHRHNRSHFSTGRHYYRHGYRGGFFRPSHYYWAGYGCFPRTHYWVVNYQPMGIVEYPVVVESPTVVIKRQENANAGGYVNKPEFDEETLNLFENIRHKKSQFLEQLRSGDKAERMKAIAELAGFSFDDKVREEMEKILLSDPDPELRKEAAKAFGKVVNEKVLAVLEKARVSDPDIAVRQEADNSIKQIKSN